LNTMPINAGQHGNLNISANVFGNILEEFLIQEMTVRFFVKLKCFCLDNYALRDVLL